MLFNSFAYAVFLPVVFTAYWLLKHRYRWILLVLASYFFYMCSGPKYGLLIFSVSTVSYLAARYIEGSKDGRRKKNALVLSALILMGILFFFKYFNFFSSTLNTIFSGLGIHKDPVILNIVLPVGISFYTFQAMGYVIDVYRGKTKAELHFGRFLAFVSFFPQLVAGPIERSENLLPQIRKEHRFDYDKAVYGVKLMLWGYYKKLVIADVLAPYVQAVYTNPKEHTGFSLVIASVFFAVQIYCDFSGYSDIAAGTAKLFGIDLLTNFRSPYFSTSIREFWSRWHISLSTWFKDYVYIPLGGNRAGRARHTLNLMITFLVSGLWHGANWTFVIWGAVHGAARTLENAVAGRPEKSKRLPVRLLQAAIVFVFLVFAWVFFVSDSVSDAVYVLGHCLAGITDPVSYLRGGLVDVWLTKEAMIIMAVCVMIMAVYDYISLKEDFIQWISRKGAVVRWGFYLLIGLMIVFLSDKGVAAEFIYFQF